MKAKGESHDLKAYLSVAFIITALLVSAIMKMEVRRMGYQFLRTTKEYKRVRDEKAIREMELAKLTQPGRIRRYAETRLTLREAAGAQIIHFSGQRIALREAH